MKKNRILSLFEFAEQNPDLSNEKEEKEESEMSSEFEVDEATLDALVEIVGSEEEVEKAAEAAYKDLKKSFDKNEIELDENAVPSKLAFAALMVKLVETGKLGPQEADDFIKNNLE